MRSTAIALVFATALLGFTACGGNTATTNTGNGTGDNSANTSNSEPAAANTNENAASNSENAANTEETPAPADKGVERIRFKAGATSGSVSGSVKGYDRKDFVVNGKKGQKMKVDLKSSSTFVYFNIADSKDGYAADMPTEPKPLDVTSWEGTLPKDGDYFIRVYLVRAEARRDGKADFTLNVSITGDAESGEKGMAMNKVHWFECPDRMEVGATFKKTSGNKEAYVEIGDTAMTLSLKPSASGEKYSDKGDKNVFWLKGEEALFDFRGKSYTCKLKA